jgi:acetyl-CoA carboxylase biotin carboxyl carrier protein
VSSDEDVIKAIVDAFERSDWAEIDVRSGSLRIHLSAQPQPSTGPLPPSPTDPPSTTSGDAESGDAVVASVAADAVPTEAPAIPIGAHCVLSPSPGIFWRSPQPGAPPFADVGDEVLSGSTLCIVEVMKLMNHISSDVPGTVVGVFVEDGVRVDRGEVLFALQPAAVP